MDSVNLALPLMLKRIGIKADVNYYYPHMLHVKTEQNIITEPAIQSANHGDLKQEFRSAHAHLDEIMASKIILYWGDFLHMAQYHRAIARRLIQKGHVSSEEDAANCIQEILFLSRAEDAVLKKSISFGGTIIFNTIADELYGKYATELTRFIKRTHRIWPRDVFSSIKFSHLLSDYSRIKPGVDCALLIHETDVRELCGESEVAIKEAVSGNIGIFFGRTKGTGFRLMKFATSIAKGMKKSMYWLPWGNHQGFPVHKTWFAPRPVSLNTMPGCEQLSCTAHLLSALKHSSLIITDTYHVAVNAWNLGTPAICVGDTTPLEPSEMRSVNSGAAYAWRDKRQTFFSMYDALDYFVHAYELQNWRWSRRRIQHILQKLDDQKAIDEIVHRMHQHRDSVEAELASEVTRLLS